MDYSYLTTSAQSYPIFGMPPTSAHQYEPQNEHNGDTTASLTILRLGGKHLIKSNQGTYQASNGFQAFNQYSRFDPSTFMPEQQAPPQESPPSSLHRTSLPNLPQVDITNGVTSNGYDDPNDQNGNRSSSEEKESLTPAQSRRKAQNRAAQRAFRERKERHVKDLESKLNSLSATSNTLSSDNERLKRELQRLATQNEILRATTQLSQPPVHNIRPSSPVPGPLTYSPTDFQAAVGVDPTSYPLSHDEFDGDDGERLLAIGATWDLIQAHELYRKGMVDIGDVVARLRGRAACDGRGLAFPEKVVRRAIEESVLGGSDELI